MRKRTPFVSTAIAIVLGLATLYFYFFPAPGSQAVRTTLLQWAASLAAVALVVGVGNLVSVHARKITDESADWFNSVVLIGGLAITFGIVLLRGPDHLWSRFVFSSIQVPVEISLMAVLAVSLAYASTRLLRRKPNTIPILFVLTALIALAGSISLPLLGDFLASFRAWIAQVPAVAGARGILLGIALGTITTGVRILLGSDRPYGG